MAESNPFHLWLGLDPKTKNPHHFQLLGVSPKLLDQKEIEQAVNAGVKKCLVGLAKVPDGKHAELVNKLKQRIAVARKTLLDPSLRAAYLKKLKQQVRAQQVTKLPSKTKKNVDIANLAPHLPVTPSSVAAIAPPSPPVAAIQAQDAAVPMAVSLPPGSQRVVPASVPMNQVSEVAVNSDGVPIDDVKISRAIGRRRKKSKLGLIVGILMLVLTGVGAFLIYKNKDTLFDLVAVAKDSPAGPGIVKEKPVIPDAVVPAIGGSEKEKGLPNKTDYSVSSFPTLDLDALPELDEHAVLAHPETQAATMRNEDQLAQVIANEKERIGVVESEKKMEPGVKPTGSAADSVPEEEPEGPLVKFDDFQLSKIRRHLERASRSIERHELDAATTAIDYANSVRAEVAIEPNSHFDSVQAPVAQLVEETKEIHDLVVGFWAQVVASCQDIPGSQEIEASGQKIAYLEADESQVIVRHAGANVTYEYKFCPPSLAVALATQGAIADIPTWGKQLAAFYAVDQVVNGKDHSEKIDELLKVAESAGHDCSGIRHYAQFKFGKIGVPDKKIEMPNKRTFKETIAEFRKENQYGDPAKVSPGTGIMIADLLLQVDSPNFEQHVALLEESRIIGIQIGEASITEDAIIELAKFAEIDQANLTCESFIEIAKSQLTSRQRRTFAERAIPFLRSELAGGAKLRTRQSLAKKLADLATAYNLVDISRRVNQIDGLD